jgi:4-nitrophenyl phosphatase
VTNLNATPVVGLDLARLRAVILDVDGTLWRDHVPLPGLGAWFDFLHDARLPFLLATNNAYWPPEYYVEKLAGFGVAISADQVLTSAQATAIWARGVLPAGSPVYVVGGDALRAALAGAGYLVVPDDQSPVAAVVAGVDFELTYAKLRCAARLIRRGARFIGTNADRSYPAADGLAPGAGVVLAAIEAATDVAPEVVGKPQRPMYDVAVARLGQPADRTLMVGDRLDTDILGARRAGLPTVLVTTGIDGPDEVSATGIMPDLVLGGLDELRVAWQAALTPAPRPRQRGRGAG